MTDLSFVFAICLGLLIGVLSPGPSFLMVTQTALSKSRKQGIAVALGMGVGAAIFSFVAILGLHIVLETLPTLYRFLKILGGLYLLRLAHTFWRKTPSCSESNPKQEPVAQNISSSFLAGLLTQLSNPKTALVIGGIFAAFLPPNTSLTIYAALVLLAFIIDSGWYSVVAIVLSTPKAQKIYLTYGNQVGLFSALLMSLMGLKLILDV